MFKKTMKFDDLNGREVEQTFYFNYNKKEIAELLEFGEIQKFRDGKPHLPLEEQYELLSLPTEVTGLTQQENTQQAYDIFQNLLLNAYGEKGADNVSFIKNQKLRDYWEGHVAFPDLIFEMIEDPELFAQFIMQCLPPKLVAQAKTEIAKESDPDPSVAALFDSVDETPTEKEPAPVAPKAVSTEARIDGMTDAEILSARPMDLTRAQLLHAMKLRSASNSE